MNAERWALIVGAVTVIAIRIIDWWMPKGYHSRWADRHGIKDKESDDVDE